MLIYRYTLAMGYLLAIGEIFENMLQLKGFGLYFERVMKKNGHVHIEIMIYQLHAVML